MKKIGIILFVSLLFLISNVSAEEVGNKGLPVVTETPLTIKTIVPIFKETTYELIEYSTDLLISIKQRLGLEPKEKLAYGVIIGDRLFGIIPPTSKFMDLQIHEDCLAFQYGTINWYECEESK